VRETILQKDERYWNAQQLRGERPRINLENSAFVWRPRAPFALLAGLP
jgi:hypothetical protein